MDNPVAAMTESNDADGGCWPGGFGETNKEDVILLGRMCKCHKLSTQVQQQQ
ncbi:hypothetical protein EV177_005747, partial [Coemansia sp. RSA 1804]